VTTTPAYAPGMDALTIAGTISKVDEDQRQVFGWASVTEVNGRPVIDRQNDMIDTYEIEKAAYEYVLNSRVGGEMHERVKKDAPKQVGTLIESMVLTPEKIAKMGLPEDTPRGWWIGFQIAKDERGDKAWDLVKKGKYTSFSIHGLGKRLVKSLDEVEKSVTARSEQEILGWLARVAGEIGVDPEELALALDELIEEKGDVDDDELHDFLMERFGSGQMLAKHLLGRHEQQDHDPRKSKDLDRAANPEGRGETSFRGLKHSRKEHRELRGAKQLYGHRLADYNRNADRVDGLIQQARDGKKPTSQDIKTMSELLGIEVKTEQDGNEWFYMEKRLAANHRQRTSRSDPKAARLIAALYDYFTNIPAQNVRMIRQAIGKNVTPEQFLVTKAAQRASTQEEFAANVEEIGKALSEVNPEAAAYFDAVHKHLIGRHEQQDHDPTKRGARPSHTRSQHGGRWGKGGVERGTKIGAGIGVGAGLLVTAAGRRFGVPTSAVRRVAGGAFGGGLTGYQVGGGQIFGNRLGAPQPTRVGAGLANSVINLPATTARRLIHGDPNAYYAQRRHGARRKKLSKRQLEVLEKYLGPLDQGDEQ
jgi:hypothetical protein